MTPKGSHAATHCVALACRRDARSPYSNLPHFLYRSLRQRYLVAPAFPRQPVGLAGRVMARLARSARGGGRSCEGPIEILDRGLAAGRRIDAAIAPMASDLVPLLQKRVPTIHLSDATPHLMSGFYDGYSLTPESYERERAAIRSASAAVFPSNWAARSAIDDYGADPSRVHVVPFGGNLFTTPAARIADQRRLPAGRPFRLFVIGRDWRRKGCDLATETVVRANDAAGDGLRFTLTLVGFTPESGRPLPECVAVTPPIDKTRRSGRLALDQLYREHDAMLAPSRADCSPHVLGEAFAYGLPVLSSDVGGIPEINIDGMTGFTADLKHLPEALAARLVELATTPEQYRAICREARRHFEADHCWDRWLERMAPIIESIARS